MQRFLVLLSVAIAVMFFVSNAKAQSFGDLRLDRQAAAKMASKASRDGAVRLIVMVEPRRNPINRQGRDRARSQ